MTLGNLLHHYLSVCVCVFFDRLFFYNGMKIISTVNFSFPKRFLDSPKMLFLESFLTGSKSPDVCVEKSLNRVYKKSTKFSTYFVFNPVLNSIGQEISPTI